MWTAHLARSATNNRFRKQNVSFEVPAEPSAKRVKLFEGISALPLICFNIYNQLLTQYILETIKDYQK